MTRIPVAGPSITEREIAYVTEAARGDWYDGAGTFTRRFEEAFAARLGLPYAVSLPSCTSALHLSLAALGIGPGDEVIVPDITWIASAAPVSYVGATPVFADIDGGTWCLDPAVFEAAITPRTRAVIPVDLYGNMPDFPAIRAIAARHDIAVIEDAAEAMGSALDGRAAGAFGDTGVFSFHGSKTMTTGEGGMLVTGDDRLYRRVVTLRDHGRRPGDIAFFNAEVAFKYKMSGLQAALGLAQLERIDDLVAKKRWIFARYAERLGGVPGLALNPERAGECNSYWMTTVVWDSAIGIGKDAAMAALAAQGIDSRPFFHPLSSLPAYAGAADGPRAQAENVTAYRIAGNGINLPSALSLTEGDIDHVCDALLEILGFSARPPLAARV